MKNKKIILTVVIILISLIVIAGASFAAIYFMTDIFKSEQELFWKYFGDGSKITSMLYNENQMAQEKLKAENSYTSTGNLDISIEGQKSDIGVVTTSRHDKNTGRTYADMTLKKGEKDIIKGSYINSGDVYAIQCKDIYEQYYIGVRNKDLKKLAQNLGINGEELENIPDSIDFTMLETALKFSDAEKQHIIDTYSKVIFDSIPKECYKKAAIALENEKGYELALNSETLKQLILNCLSTLKNDTETINLIVTKMSSLSSEIEINAEELVKQIDESISKLQNENLDIDVLIQVNEQKGKNVKTTINITNSERQVSITIAENSINVTNVSMTEEEPEGEISEIQMHQVKLQDNSIQSTIQFVISESDDKDEIIELQTTYGAVQNNQVDNSYIVNVIEESGETEKDILELTYDTQVTATDTIEEIMELKDSNAVIINNYPMEQLVVFFGGIMENTEKVLENVASQLEIDL